MKTFKEWDGFELTEEAEAAFREEFCQEEWYPNISIVCSGPGYYDSESGLIVVRSVMDLYQVWEHEEFISEMGCKLTLVE